MVPAPRECPLQFIDARDLAAFIVGIAERGVGGTFNATGATGLLEFGTLIDALQAAAPGAPAPAWIDAATLLRHGVEPWVSLPLWLPASEADHAGFMRIDTRRAQAQGVTTRALADTIADTARWLATRDNAAAWKLTPSGCREAEILAAA